MQADVPWVAQAPAQAPEPLQAPPAPPSRAQRALTRAREIGARIPLARAAWAFIAAGVLLRLAAPFFMDLRSDGDTYSAMGHAFAQTGGFLMPWGDVTTWLRADPAYSWHYPPAYPFYLGLVFKVFGFGLWQTKLAAVAMSLAALPVVYALSRNLYGHEHGLLVTSVVAVEPHLIWVTGTGFSENLVLIFFAATLWGILKSLDSEPYIIVAGAAAALTYLTRASMGAFFVVAGGAGFVWRFLYMRWRVFTNRSYLVAIALFGSVVLLWAWRNVHHHGWSNDAWPDWSFLGIAQTGWPNWHTSSYTAWAQEYAFAHPDLLRKALLHKIPLFLGFFLIYAIPFAPECVRSVRRIREEPQSALWLAIILVFVIAWIMTSVFWTYEQSSLYWLDNHRYVVIAYLPLLWIAVQHARSHTGGFRLRYVLFAALALVACVAAFTLPVKFADIEAGKDLNQYLHGGEEIAVDGGTIKYAFYPYLARHDVTIYGFSDCIRDPTPCERPHYIVTLKAWEHYPGYHQKGEDYVVRYWNGAKMTARLLERDDMRR